MLTLDFWHRLLMSDIYGTLPGTLSTCEDVAQQLIVLEMLVRKRCKSNCKYLIYRRDSNLYITCTMPSLSRLSSIAMLYDQHYPAFLLFCNRFLYTQTPVQYISNIPPMLRQHMWLTNRFAI
jgi:hypothetical protein